MTLYLVWDVVVGQFDKHLTGQTIDNSLTGLTSSTARILWLYAHNSLQHSVRRVCLVSEPRADDIAKFVCGCREEQKSKIRVQSGRVPEITKIRKFGKV